MNECNSTTRPKRLRRLLWRTMAAGALLVVVLGFVSLDTVDHQPYTNTNYYSATSAGLRTRAATNALLTGPLLAGFGRTALTPTLNASALDPANGKFRAVPLAGYGARRGKPATGVHDDLHVKAIAVQVGSRVGVFVAADALIIPREIADQAMEQLRTLGLTREQVYLGATHTHCSLGGWGEGPVQEMFAGDFQPEVRVWFAGCIVRAVREALADLQPASFGHGSFLAPDLVRNRLLGKEGKTDPELTFLVFAQQKGRSAVLGSFSAHATVLSDKVMEFSGDYPGAWQRLIEEKTGGLAMFMASGVGSHSPAASGSGFEKVERLALALATNVLGQLPGLALTNVVTFGVLGAEVHLSPLQVRVSNTIRLRPWLAQRLLGVKQDAFVQAFRLNDCIWFSTPCDYSGELALQIKDSLDDQGFGATVTSFNGDYIGYVIPSAYYQMNGYEPRVMSFFGPDTADYLQELLQTLAANLTVGQTLP